MAPTFLKCSHSSHRSHILHAHKTMLAQLPNHYFPKEMDTDQELSDTLHGFAHSSGMISSGMEHLAYSGCRDFSAINFLSSTNDV